MDVVHTKSIDDAKFYPLTDDTPGAPVYGPAIDIGCVKKLTWTDKVTEGENRGDNRVCVRDQTLDQVDVTIEHGGLNMELREAMLGQTLSSFTAGGNNGRKLVRRFSDPPMRGAIIARSPKPSRDGDTHIVIPNVQIKLGNGGEYADQAYRNTALAGVADASLYSPEDDAYWEIEHEDAVTDIPSTFPGTSDY